jgi:hypothetical protein
LSTIIIQKEVTAIKCICGYFWYTASKSKYPACPKCHSQISKKLHEVIVKVPQPGIDSTQAQVAGTETEPLQHRGENG